MKRILSLIMSVLMIATMFCGFATTSTAADGDVVEITVVSELQEDGSYYVTWYAKDLTEFGFHLFAVDVEYDEEALEPVLRKVGTTTKTGYIQVWDMQNYLKNGCGISLGTKLVIAGTNAKPKDAFIDVTAAYDRVYFDSTDMGVGVGFNRAYIEGDYVGADPADYNYDDELGFPIANCYFNLKEGYTSGECTASVYGINIALDGETGAFEKADDRVTINSATIGSTEPDEPVVPALPEGITLEVQAGVQARYSETTPGLRFTTVATATDWSAVTEMGTAIVKAGTKPGVDTTLVVPARVDWDGDYLQAYTKEDGKYNFEDGITTNKASVTYTGVISNIKDANKDVEFEAYAYIIVDGVTYYSANSESATYNEIFGAAQNDPTIA